MMILYLWKFWAASVFSLMCCVLSFRGLVSLRTLDLSRNRLHSAPAEAFSHLSWLISLDLDQNLWNCSCQLLEWAAFLSSFIQQPDKVLFMSELQWKALIARATSSFTRVWSLKLIFSYFFPCFQSLYNGHRMVCVSANNPAVTTVLELTEANCVPFIQNITVQTGTRGSMKPQLYVQDLAITAVICFIGENNNKQNNRYVVFQSTVQLNKTLSEQAKILGDNIYTVYIQYI